MAANEFNLDEDERRGKAVISVPKKTEEALAQAMAMAKEMNCEDAARAGLSVRVVEAVEKLLNALKAKASTHGNGNLSGDR